MSPVDLGEFNSDYPAKTISFLMGMNSYEHNHQLLASTSSANGLGLVTIYAFSMLSYEQRKLVYSRTPRSPCPSDIPLITGDRIKKETKKPCELCGLSPFPP
jgi:hypothetical protein